MNASIQTKLLYILFYFILGFIEVLNPKRLDIFLINTIDDKIEKLVNMYSLLKK